MHLNFLKCTRCQLEVNLLSDVNKRMAGKETQEETTRDGQEEVAEALEDIVEELSCQEE